MPSSPTTEETSATLASGAPPPDLTATVRTPIPPIPEEPKKGKASKSVPKPSPGKATPGAKGKAPDDSEPPPFEFLYDNDSTNYWRKVPQGHYVKVSEANLKRHLQWKGFEARGFVAGGVTNFDAAICQAQNERAVDHTISLAGHKPGIFETEDGRKILVPQGPRLITPKPGPIEHTDRLLTQLFGQQVPTVLGWMKVAIEDLYSLNPASWRHHQMLAIVGKPDCGKSFFQMLLTLLMGGRSADPYLWMVNKTNFNEDLAEAEHLTMGDKNAFRDIKSRTQFGSMIKQLTVESKMAIHGKGKKAIQLPCFRRLTISINDDADYITVLPLLDASVGDKLILLNCGKAQMLEDYQANRERFTKELPAVVDFLMKYRIPQKERHSRFGVKTFHSPEILEILNQFEPHLRFLELIDSVFPGENEDPVLFKGTATQLQTALCDSSAGMAARQLLSSSVACGQLLTKLCATMPGRFNKTVPKGTSSYTILARND